MSLQSILKASVRRLSLHSGASALKARLQPGIRIIMFHGVGEDYPVEAFESQLRYLVRHYRVLPVKSVLEWLGKGGGSPPAVVLTFDDGLRNHFTNVYPVLRKSGLPATFYVCPELIERGQWLWNHEARERLRSLEAGDRGELAASLGAPGEEVERIVAWMKTLPPGSRTVAEASIRAATRRFEPTPEQQVKYDLMSWDELRRLDTELVTIGSHTLSHPILTALSLEDARREVLESARWLEERLRHPVEHFCYPNGENDDAIVDLVRQRYRTAVTTEPGVLDPGDDPHRLKRVPTAPTLELLAWRMHRPTA